MKLLVLDGNSILNRAFYGIKLLTTKEGMYTNAIYGFMNILLKLEDAEKPDEIAIAFDRREPTFRHKMYDGYKAQRKGMPEELVAQLAPLKELLDLLGYKEVSLAGFEADDILGTLARAAAQRGEEALLATGDRDSLQLVQPGVTVLLTTTQFGKGETARMDETAIFEKYGITPPQLIDVKALMGDSSDNIPGVAGIGEKTALALIQKFSTLEGVYQNIDDPFIKPGQRQKLLDGKDSALLSRTLGTINCEVPVDSDSGFYAKTAPKAAEAAALLARLEMYTISNRLGLEAAQTSFLPTEEKPALPAATVSPLPAELEGRVFLAQAGETWLVTTQKEDTIYTSKADDPNLFALLCSPSAEKWAFDVKPLHKICLLQNQRAQNLVFDGLLAAYLLNPAASSYTVSNLSAEYAASATVSCQDYPDAPLMASLYITLYNACKENGMLPLLEKIEQPLAEVLASMELVGIPMDSEGVHTFGVELRAELEKQLASIYEIAGCEFNVNSPKQLGEVLFEKMGLPHRRKTKSGWSTDAETLDSLREYSPIIDAILQYRTYTKLNSTYVEGLLKEVRPDERIHSTFNQTEARTGRISSNEPNLQNIPVRTELGSRLRRYFTASPGSTLADADYSQIELRILAHISEDEAMRNAFKEGQDIHRATAAKVNGVPLEEVTSAMRSAAKAVNFGIVYGIGAFSLSKDLGISVKEADSFIQTYLDSFPGVRTYMEKTVTFGKEHGYVETLFGRRRPLPELASSNKNIQALGQRMALNTPIQGTAADIIKLAMIRVWRRLRKENLQAQLVLQVHDELIVDAPLQEADAVSKLLQEEMQNAASLAVPLDADVHTGTNWYDAKG